MVRMYEITVGGCTRRHGRSSGDTVSEHPTFPQTRIPERRAACTPDSVGRNGRARVTLTPDPHTSSATCRRSSLHSNAPTGSVTHAVPPVPIAKSASSPHGGGMWNPPPPTLHAAQPRLGRAPQRVVARPRVWSVGRRARPELPLALSMLNFRPMWTARVFRSGAIMPIPTRRERGCPGSQRGCWARTTDAQHYARPVQVDARVSLDVIDVRAQVGVVSSRITTGCPLDLPLQSAAGEG